MSLSKSTKKKGGFSKFIKKLAKVLLIAAAVYFGGAYLMSMSAGASQAASVATSFTKSAGVWKSFLGGLSTGTASSSAAAYASASYDAMVLNLPVSAQAAAGTSAVSGLANNLQTGAAVAKGVAAGQEYQKIFDANPGMAKNQILEQAMSNSGVPLVAPDTAAVAVDTAQTTGDGIITGTGDQAPGTGAITEQAYTATEDQSPGWQGAEVPPGAVVTPPAGEVAPSTVAPATVVDPIQQLMLDQTEMARIDRQNQHEQTMAMYDKNHRMNMYGLLMKGAGFAFNAYSQYQAGKEEEAERDRIRNWKPTGEEKDIVDPSKLKYPGGIIGSTA